MSTFARPLIGGPAAAYSSDGSRTGSPVSAATSRAMPSTESQSGRFGVTESSKIDVADDVGERRADRRVVGQHEDAFVVFGEAELALAEHHAGGLDAADLRRLEHRRLAAVAVAHVRADRREGDLLADGEVRRAADDACAARRRRRPPSRGGGGRRSGAVRRLSTSATRISAPQSPPCGRSRRPRARPCVRRWRQLFGRQAQVDVLAAAS